ncbi:cysteine desulfurase family protein [Sphingomonas jatrophae]|uniref:Cysteine desulfurase n=1 Tax=Sphingomonas jatrophae TaxID=1166337 RepID=A0A1I6L1S1_9SPHN|nr:aminotransferase class V-fold PLP-dependent enzyme [Sphingomonas jatrophae]SFR97396.1 cysteine desulfurase [Sphingomonas jatrophae]
MAARIYLDHAAATPVRPEAAAAMADGMRRWANPSSPHAEGRAARAALEEARARIKGALGWDGHLIFTSGASEAAALALAGRGDVAASAVEHDAILRHAAGRLPVDAAGQVMWPEAAGPLAVQQVNSETGVVQALDGRGVLLADCAQGAGRLALPEADMLIVSAHKLGGPPGIGALLVRDLELLRPTGGQERGYRPGTENLPAALGFAAALEAPRDWFEAVAPLRAQLDAAVEAAGGEVIGRDAPRIATIASYRMPGTAAAAQLIRFDLAGFAVSAGSACSSGTLKASHVLTAMGYDEQAAGEVIRVSFGWTTAPEDVECFAEAWTRMARGRAAA